MSLFPLLFLIGLLLSPSFAYADTDDGLALPDAGMSNHASPDPAIAPMEDPPPVEDPGDSLPPPPQRGDTRPRLREESRETKINATSKLKGYVESSLDFGLTIAYARSNFDRYFVDGNFQKPGTLDSASIGFEWLPITMYGKVGIGITSGFARATNFQLADGRFASVYVIPIEAAVSYRADYFHHQVIVPFVRVGLDASVVKQTSVTDAAIAARVGKGKVLAGGLELNLGFFEPSAAKSLDMTVGINETYFFAEYVSVMANDDTQQPNLTRHECRFGLRLEF